MKNAIWDWYSFAVKLKLFVSKLQTTTDKINIGTIYSSTFMEYNFEILFEVTSYFADSDYSAINCDNGLVISEKYMTLL